MVDKTRLIAEAARLVKPGGTIAFTDWVDGPNAVGRRRGRPLPHVHEVPQHAHARRLRGAAGRANGCEVLVAEDTGRFAPHVDLYLNMLNMQLTYDALRIIGFDFAVDGVAGRRDELPARHGPCRQDRARA